MSGARAAGPGDLGAAGALLHRFNAEFGEASPGAERLAARVGELTASGDTAVLLAGDGPAGILVIRFQPSLWSQLDEAYIAELYVVPEARRRGFGGELMTAALELCRARGCDYVFIGTDEGDADAHRLYERFGFTNRSGDELMYVYEREL
ncbi:MAG: GNAT family N-acetyltransferase [Solirubrobacterales bacterium]|nr:GNAT family N-acetyltransferase [Solirubrobacterales bacterium]